MKIKSFLLCINLISMVFMLSINYSSAIDLDAPIKTKEITSKSELVRGFSIIISASKTFQADTKYNIKVITDIINLNQQNNTDTEPFLLGAYLGSWVALTYWLDAVKSTIDKHGPIPWELKNEILIDKAINETAYYFKSYRKIQSKLEISDDDLLSILNVNKKVLIPKIYKWNRLINP